ncbi:hypothetical protein BDV25DRAFT_60332 [Aspergillus avenaceus]|uniref:Uncharacterized protein n=1 Tax=Aspergillus avenaceus TaxID=36643 RepID=A0A5N6THR3_ASPAV|nr:hypothetical protein BDV25DRAFT_60332 [Aspergillus avenaceus]
MSPESSSINLLAFAEAIKELPLSSLYTKVSELGNSLAHLKRSNEELQMFIIESCDAENEKQELRSYILENEGVIFTMNEKVMLLKVEIEGRGHSWLELEGDATGSKSNGPPTTTGISGITTGDLPMARQQSTIARAADLPRDNLNDDNEDGVYL